MKMAPNPVKSELVTARDSSFARLLLSFGVFTMYLVPKTHSVVREGESQQR